MSNGTEDRLQNIDIILLCTTINISVLPIISQNNLMFYHLSHHVNRNVVR